MGMRRPRSCRSPVRLCQLLTVVVVLLAVVWQPRPLHAQSSYTYEECQTVDRDALQAEIEALALTVLEAEGASIDVASMVDRQWQAVGMDRVIANEVDATVAALMTEAPYWQRFLSGWSAAQAEELTQVVAQRTFASPAMGVALDELAAGIAVELAAELEAAAAASASNSLLCLQAFVGEQYAQTLFAFFTREVSRDVDTVDYAGAGADYTFSAAGVHGKALAGAGIIIVSQVVRSVSVKLGQRIAGRVAGRIAGRLLGRLGTSLIPLAGWVIGGGLLIWDVVEGGRGALPQIAEALTSQEMAATMRAEVTAAVRIGLDEQLVDMAAQIAASMVAEWDGFCARHPYLCELPEESADFRMILGTTPVDELEKLAQLVDVFLATVGRAELDEAVVSGLFETLLALPQDSYTIFADTGSADMALAWSELAGSRLAGVVANRLYQVVTPGEVTALEVETLLALEDPAQIARLTTLTPEQRRAFLELPLPALRALTAQYDAAQLAGMADATAADGRSLSAAVDQLLTGALTFAELTAPTAVVAAQPTPASTPAPFPSAQDEESVPGVGRPNSVLIAASILGIILGISAFALIVVSSVKRSQH